jgi:hypothetical protein
MGRVDRRRPAAVTEDFRLRVAAALAPAGFLALARKRFVRRRGEVTDRVELWSSHHNVPGDVCCFVSLLYEDRVIAGRAPGWRAGGELCGPEFAEQPRSNLARPAEADALLARIVAGLAFFALLDDAARVAAKVQRRYLAGMVSPALVIPCLAVRLGADAARDYAAALLAGRPELWPSFLTRQGTTVTPGGPRPKPDHGTELAVAMAAAGIALDRPAPAGCVRSPSLAASNLRCFFGRQLRAWGEPKVAAALCRVGDAELLALERAQRRVPGPLVDSAPAVRLVLEATTGEARRPRRRKPRPRLFQYHVLGEPFGPVVPT